MASEWSQKPRIAMWRVEIIQEACVSIPMILLPYDIKERVQGLLKGKSLLKFY